MGEYAEMMLDGTDCQYCGAYIGSDAGFPQTCSDCAKEIKEMKSRIECPICNKLVKKNGLEAHIRNKHPIKEES